MADIAAPAKRSRARRGGRTDEVAGSSMESLSTRPRHGLLTPEASGPLESQTKSPTIEDNVAPRDKTIFPFLELPAEIRLHIYHMALVRHEPILLHAERAPEKIEEEAAHTASKVEEGGEAEGGGEAPNDWTHASSSTSSSTPSTVPRRILRPAISYHSTADSPSNNTPIPPTCPADPVVPVLLRLNQQIHKEARQLLYSENVFTLSLTSGIHTLSTLHQRSRSLIKHVVLTIPSHHDILDGFADLVRLGLRYCWGLKSFKIILDANLPDDGRAGGPGVGAASSVYANAFHILRWLPRGCSVVLEGTVSEQVRRVVLEEGRLMNVLDERSYLKRQHQMPERH
ncbi:hypothetical protein DE146DRAFT_678583 [Phaeosphaeria sp. MPI-PUGE-AT-0046c]|nr:hypothetical protein DE146DRAFT_678583 [Phaeosphaeria sp. MPI-PUGE-AT-0046c]